MKNYFLNLILLVTISLFCLTQYSCKYIDIKTFDKAEYMGNYRSFIKDVQSNHRVYTKDDWGKADAKLNDFASNVYKHFTNELTFKEELELGQLPIMYYLCRYKSVINKKIERDYRPDTQELVNSLTAIMDSTNNVYEGFDEGLRNILLDFKSRSETDKRR